MIQPESQNDSRSPEAFADEATAQATLVTVFVDLDRIALKVGNPQCIERPANGADVIWDFVVRREGRDAPQRDTPAGWVPMVLFEATSEGFGPFSSLTQVVKLDDGGEVESMTVEGRFSPDARSPDAKDLPGDTASFPYHAMLYRGVGGELIKGRTLSLMASELSYIEISRSAIRSRMRVAPPRPLGKTHNLEVVIDSGANKLDVFPTTYPLAGPRDRVVWDFKIRQGEFVPLILFYEFRPRLGIQTPQINFGPFERLTISRRCVEGSRLNAFGGHYHYEAAILSSRNLSMQWLSSGDPVVDNEGIGLHGEGVSQ